MALMKGVASNVCLGLIIVFSSSAWSQNEDATSEKLQLLQQQLDELKGQMQNIELQIRVLQIRDLPKQSKPSVVAATYSPSPAVASTPSPSGKATQQGATAQQQQESGAAQAAELGITPKRQVGQATATYETNSQDQIAAPRIDNAPIDPRYPGYFRIPGTLTLMKIGGYFKTDFIYDLKPPGQAEKFVPSSFPIPSPPSVNNNTVSIRPTRMNFDFLIPIKSSSVRFFIEFDMFGENSTTPRLRHAYAQVSNFLVGQSFSNFMDPDSGPDTLDFEGPNSQVSIRNPQFRYTIPLGEKTSFALSLEKASSDVAFTTPTFNSLPNSPSPDGAAKFRHEYSSGHVQLSTVLRTPGAYFPNGKSDSVVGWGFDLTGLQRLFGKNNFVYQGAYGAGYERYVQDTSGLGIDAAPKDADHFKALPLVATYGGYQHYWTNRWRSSAVYGYAQVQNTALEPGSAYHQSDYGAANVIWNPFGSLNVGTEFLYGWLIEKSNARASDTRFMFSAKYNFVKTGETKK